MRGSVSIKIHLKNFFRFERIGTVGAVTESALGFSLTVKTLFGPSVGVGSFPRDVATSCVDAFWKMPHKGEYLILRKSI